MDQYLRDLRAAAREGDDRATAELVLALQPAIWKYCSIVGPVGQEVSLVETAFLRAFEALRAGDPDETDVTIWVLRAARIACGDATRRLEREVRRAQRSRWKNAQTPVMGSRDIDRLPLERREVWALVEGMAFDAATAARIIGASEATVKVRLAHAMSVLSVRGPASDVG